MVVQSFFIGWLLHTLQDVYYDAGESVPVEVDFLRIRNFSNFAVESMSAVRREDLAKDGRINLCFSCGNGLTLT
jgi:hypothetical protein